MFNSEMETLAREKLTTLQDERLRTVLERVHAHVPFYRQALETAGLTPGDVRGVHDLHKLPFTRKEDLRQSYPFGMFAAPQTELIRVHASSGTTGKPTIVGYTRSDLEVFGEVVARCLSAAGARPGMVFHNAYGYGLFTGGLGLHYGGEKLGLTVVPVSGGMTERQLTLIGDLKPGIIACTPSYAQTLGEAFAARGVSPEAISLRFGILGAEPWSETIRQDVEASLGIRATNIYGLSEVIGPGVANEDCAEQDGSYIWEDHFYPEVVHPDSGESLSEGQEGVLVITTLTKEALPLVRYWTGDITTLTREPGTTGRSHARMGMIRGRSDDMLIIRGVNVYPTQIEAALSSIPEASSHYQLVVRRTATMDELELKLELSEAAFTHIGQGVLDDGPPQAGEAVRILKAHIAQRIKDTVGVTLAVSLLAPGHAPRSEGGKLRRTLDERKL